MLFMTSMTMRELHAHEICKIPLKCQLLMRQYMQMHRL